MKVIVDRSKLEEDTLFEFIDALKNVMPGCHIEVEEIYSIDVDDPKAASILQSLFGRNGNTEEVKKEKSEKKHRRHAYYEILSGSKAGEKFLGGSLSLMVKAGNIEAGTRLRHPEKGELIVVIGENDLLKLVPAAQ